MSEVFVIERTEKDAQPNPKKPWEACIMSYLGWPVDETIPPFGACILREDNPFFANNALLRRGKPISVNGQQVLHFPTVRELVEGEGAKLKSRGVRSYWLEEANVPRAKGVCRALAQSGPVHNQTPQVPVATSAGAPLSAPTQEAPPVEATPPTAVAEHKKPTRRRKRTRGKKPKEAPEPVAAVAGQGSGHVIVVSEDTPLTRTPEEARLINEQAKEAAGYEEPPPQE